MTEQVNITELEDAKSAVLAAGFEGRGETGMLGDDIRCMAAARRGASDRASVYSNEAFELRARVAELEAEQKEQCNADELTQQLVKEQCTRIAELNVDLETSVHRWVVAQGRVSELQEENRELDAALSAANLRIMSLMNEMEIPKGEN